MGEKWKWWQILFSWTPKSLQTVTAAMKLKNAYSLEGKYDKPRQLKSWDITLLTKICIVKAMVFPVVMNECQSWTIKKAECQRIDFELCWRRLLRVPWNARRSNQSILKEINPEYSLEGLMLKRKFQYFGHLTRRASLLEKTWCRGEIVSKRRREWQRMVR